MKLHKLLYFLYRENIIKNNKPLFNDKFYAWKFGPVLKSIRNAYKSGKFDSIAIKEEIKNDKELNDLIDFAIEEYGRKNSWSLSRLTHGEISWKNARTGIAKGTNGDIVMEYKDIEKDAKNIKSRRKRFNGVNSVEDKNKYRITDKQKELLKSFQCIRLKDYNCSNVYNFINERNKNISDTFNDDGLKEDKEREKAYYVIIRENKIALFFFY